MTCKVLGSWRVPCFGYIRIDHISTICVFSLQGVSGSFHRVWSWMMSVIWMGHCSLSVVDLLMHTVAWSSIGQTYIGVLNMLWRKPPRTCVAAKQTQVLISPPMCLTVGIKCFCWYAVFGSCQTWCLIAKHLITSGRHYMTFLCDDT